jgi:hypothetical protein
MRARKRARGRAYPCACGEEKLRLTHRGVDARVTPYSYLFGECGGGVRLRFEGIKVVEVQTVSKVVIDQIRNLPARPMDLYQSALEGLDEKTRHRLDELVALVRETLAEGTHQWIEAGGHLCEAKKTLKKGDFGLWVRHNGLDPATAMRFMRAYEVVASIPGFISTSKKTIKNIGHWKLFPLSRLSPAKRLEIIEEGVPVNGGMKPLADVTYRDLNAYVKSVVGRDPRGRKAKEKLEEPRPKERFGIPIDLFEPIQQAAQALQRLKVQIKRDALDPLNAGQHRAVYRLWMNVNALCYELHNDYGLGELLEEARR